MAASLPSIPTAAVNLTPTPHRKPPPITISTTRSHADPLLVSHLLAASNLSPHRFPAVSPSTPVSPSKLRIAIDHSFVVVSVFCRARFLAGEGPGLGIGEFFERIAPGPGRDHRLVGFGRAVSDGGLTASIHDVAVSPSLRRLGIGRKIIDRIIRVLTSRGIYDISALCSEEERLFFKACRFGDDTLGATTMMYIRNLQDYSTSGPDGRALLLVPPAWQPCPSKMTNVNIDNLEAPPASVIQNCSTTPIL